MKPVRISRGSRSRFPNGSFVIAPDAGDELQQVGGDELLFLDGQSRQQPYVCLVTAPVTRVGLRIRGQLIAEAPPGVLWVTGGERLIPELKISCAASGPYTERVARLTDIVPWYTHNALVHYLSPRGLEQYSGGGWGTRDVCQGPVEMLLALERVAPIRDLLLRVMAAQNPDGDWPQWFMFFERERDIRADDFGPARHQFDRSKSLLHEALANDLAGDIAQLLGEKCVGLVHGAALCHPSVP